MKWWMLVTVLLLMTGGCMKRPTRADLLRENEKIRAENAELRHGILDLARKYKALRGPYMDPRSPAGKDK